MDESNTVVSAYTMYRHLTTVLLSPIANLDGICIWCGKKHSWMAFVSGMVKTCWMAVVSGMVKT